MLYAIASFLSIGSGLILFSLGTYGLLGHAEGGKHVVTQLLTPLGYGGLMDSIYLSFLAVLGFWLTTGLFVEVPAAMALGVILGKLVLVGDLLRIDGLMVLALILILASILLRLIAPTGPKPSDEDLKRFWFW